MSKRSQFAIVLWLSLLLVASCATQQPLVTIGPEKGEAAIDVKASDFKFEPNNIKAFKGEELVFKIDNISGTEHNLTIKDPQGKELKSVSLPPKETTTVKVSLQESGDYEFYCDKPFHSTFGMKGRIEVVPAP